MEFTLKQPVILLLLFLFVTLHTFGQDAMSEINTNWKGLKEQLQRRSDILANLANVLSKSSEVDKKQLNNTKAFAVDLFKYVDTMSLIDSVSISLAVIKNNKLIQALARTLVTTENDPKLRSRREFGDLLMQLEGCENRIAVAKRDYNEVCKTKKRTDLLFGLDQAVKTPVVKF